VATASNDCDFPKKIVLLLFVVLLPVRQELLPPMAETLCPLGTRKDSDPLLLRGWVV
jgi:hypothetical protein